MNKPFVFGCVAALAASITAADVPFCALRFGYRSTQPDKWPEMRAALAKNRGAFDEVWFSTGVTFPSLAWHEEHARQCAAAAADLRRLGIVPSVGCRWRLSMRQSTDRILSPCVCAVCRRTCGVLYGMRLKRSPSSCRSFDRRTKCASVFHGSAHGNAGISIL